MNSSRLPPARLAWTVWSLGAILYLIAFYQRVAPAVMTTELMRDFNITAAALGNLSAFYFYSYVAMQIPTGIIAGLREVLRYGNVWLMLLVPGGVSGPVLTFAGLWGVPYLTTHYSLTTTQAAAMTSAFLIAWAVGGPLLGALSDRIGRRKPLYIGGAMVSAAAWAVIIFVPALPLLVLIVLLIIIGFSAGAIVIGFAFVKESVPLRLAGTVSGIANMGVMLGGMILQPAVGWMLDRYWTGTMQAGARIYDTNAYRHGFMLMLAWAVLSVALVSVTRETHCKQMA